MGCCGPQSGEAEGGPRRNVYSWPRDAVQVVEYRPSVQDPEIVPSPTWASEQCQKWPWAYNGGSG